MPQLLSSVAGAIVIIAALAGVVHPLPLSAAEMIPLSVDWTKGSQPVVSFSSHIEKPAGKSGPLRVQDGKIVTPSGKRFRFWGVNLAIGTSFPPKDAAPKIAQDLADMGMNVVRLHHLDVNWGGSLFRDDRDTTQEFDVDRLDRLDFFIAELIRQGIYINFGLNVTRFYKAGDNVRDHQLLGPAKGSVYFNPRLIELQKAYARNLLTHKNPYTGNEYRHEPGVAVVEILNENSLVEAWWQRRLDGRDEQSGDTWSPLPVSYAQELTDRFNAWLLKHYSAEAIAGFRDEQKVAAGTPLPRLVFDQFWSVSKERFRAEAKFLMDLEDSFFREMTTLLKDDLGVTALLVGSADHNDWQTGYPHQTSLAKLDLIDGHGYWEHPKIGAKTSTKNTAMVNDPLDSTVVQFARTAMAGKPFTISEVNHPFPHQFACEGYPILTAYALLQDWDGIYWFDWEYGRLQSPEIGIQKFGWFDVSNDPVKVASLLAAAAMWHGQDVAAAQKAFTRMSTREHVLDTLLMNNAQERPFFWSGFPKALPLIEKTRWTFGPKLTREFPAVPEPTSIRSSTGQLHWQSGATNHGLVTIDSPSAQGAIGFLANRPVSLSHLQVDVSNPFSAVQLQTLDDQPIAQSARLLLTVCARSTNTDFAWEPDGQTVAEWGHGPTVIEPVIGKVGLLGLNENRSWTVQPLLPTGRLMTIAAKTPLKSNVASGLTLTLTPTAAVSYLISQE